MPGKAPPDDLVLPHPEPPESGTVIEVAPGVLWLRLALPFRLDHVNVYLVEDGTGWALIDTGLGDAPTLASWERLFAGPLACRRLTRIIATHFHPDHVGAAGWLAKRFGLRVEMSETEYLMSRNLHLDPGGLDADHYREFYLRHGLSEQSTNEVVTRGHHYLRLMTDLPPTFRRIVEGDVLTIGGRELHVLTGAGHAPEQVMLFSPADRLFFSADQVLARISPNVSVTAVDPEGDPLGLYLRSLAALRRTVPGDVLVLPGHDVPFIGLHARLDGLERHHEARCAQIADACRTAPRSAAELVPVLFNRPLDPQQTSFAFSEVLAHVNFMVRGNRLGWISPAAFVRRARDPAAGRSDNLEADRDHA